MVANKRVFYMKCIARSILVLLAAVFLTGCVGISIGNRSSKPPPPPEPVVVVATEPEDKATLAEIDAAGRLSFDQNRKETLKAIAQRPGLTPAAQVHLANTTFRRMDFDNQKVEVLLALVRNPGFCAPAKQTIMTQLNQLSFDNDRQTILREVNERESGR